MPFAHWLVHALRPRVIVELGTHHGLSYSAFCEGVVQSRLDASCYAVDTWKGDEHAGVYGEEVYRDFKSFHDARYAAFSQLLRTTFDDALPYFADGSIDLLHIDGFHTYEAVSGDFHRWRPKLSGRSVALFHDTNVRERDFGVWRFWEQVRKDYPSFEFLHGHGLGVLIVGAEVPAVIASLSTLADMEAITRFRERFATLGQRHVLEFDLSLAEEKEEAITLRLDAETSRRDGLERELAEREARIAILGQEHEAQVLALRQGLAGQLAQLRQERTDEAAELSRQLASARAMADRAKELVRRLREESTRQYRQHREHCREAARSLELAKEETARAECENAVLVAKLTEREAVLSQQVEHIKALLDSTSWRIAAPVRVTRRLSQYLLDRVRLFPDALASFGTAARRITDRSSQHHLAAPVEAEAVTEAEAAPAKPAPTAYTRWIERFDQLTMRDRQAIRKHIAAGSLPSIVVLLYFDRASQDQAAAAVLSLQSQLFDRWRAVLCCGEDCDPTVLELLRASIREDPRFTVAHAPLDDIGWREMDKFSGFDAILLASGLVALREHTLYLFSAFAEANPHARLIYADNDQMDQNGERRDPYFKPQFSPELFRSSSYLGPCVLLRGLGSDVPELMGHIYNQGGVSSCVEGAVRIVERREVARIPFVLYHVPWTAIQDVSESLAQRHENGEPSSSLADRDLPTVSIIIPTRDRLDLLEPCLAGIQEATTYPRSKLEVIVIDNDSMEPSSLKFLSQAAAQGKIKLLHDRQPFNYSRINNAGARVAGGDILVFLNNDTRVNDPDWLRCLAKYVVQDDIGAVGAKLLYPDHTVQHGGVILGVQGVAAHAHIGLGERESGYHDLANRTHEVSAVTGACLAVRKAVFEEVGGFNPDLAVAFNDVLLCLDLSAKGYRNIYIGAPLMEHYESSTRGFDDTPEKAALFRHEATRVRRKYLAFFKDDPFYSPNLSLDRVYDLAFPPRKEKPWRRFARGSGEKLRVLMLSCTHEVGHGVAVVLDLQAAYLSNRDYEVYVGGPAGRNEFAYEGCHRVYLDTPVEAATFAVEHDIDCIIAHTPPFFSVVRWTGEWPKTIFYDYGEPNPDFFPDAAARRDVLAEKRFCYNGADRVYGISKSVQDEAGDHRLSVIPLGNSHLATWDEGLASRRNRMRAAFGWGNKVVVLNVCRFYQAERHYKGIDVYAAIAEEFKATEPLLRSEVVFVLCGRGTDADVREMEAAGLRVCANVSDSELIDLYAASDVYMSFSKWEGYNLGIGQALALGLPVIASDIPAHREFPIFTSEKPTEIIGRLAEIAEQSIAQGLGPERRPVISPWKEPLSQFAAAISELCLGAPAPDDAGPQSNGGQ